MPISGLVIAFAGPIEEFPLSMDQLSKHPAVEVGQINGHLCAIAVDTDCPASDRDFWQWVHELPGVVGVNVAFVGFEDDAPSGLPT